MRLKSLFAIAVTSFAAAAAAAPTYIHAGRLIDVPGSVVRGPSTIVLDNGRIISVTDGLTRAEPGVPVTDLSTKTVLKQVGFVMARGEVVKGP